ncbi:hypothetical protein EVAR_48366_1 [Eumeta japonica]|uniref:Uncharacterized protein n=1 Tax=Eumeta variegata TaxID=151549 RepID=A0A4C1WJS7_EUMVA|nr:hypothetical protein EVAR_48366_1 [Eumeta japonica]
MSGNINATRSADASHGRRHIDLGCSAEPFALPLLSDVFRNMTCLYNGRQSRAEVERDTALRDKVKVAQLLLGQRPQSFWHTTLAEEHSHEVVM